MSIKINDKCMQYFKFPGGECHANVCLSSVEIGRHTEIVAYLKHSDDIMMLLLCVNAIRVDNPHTEINLYLPYLPYARQDRVCNAGEPLSIQVMANLINSLNCNSVIVYDEHSSVTTALLKNCEHVPMETLLL